MKPIVVLGMHRSGTSAVTRALGILGAALGSEANTGEYWENTPMRRVNEDILASFGGAWECPPILDDAWVDAPDVQAMLPRGREVVAEEYGDAEVMAWKDPRTCITLPFWRQVFAVEPVLVCIHRHPFEVARSLLTRDGFGRGHSFALWERYNADALMNALGLPTVVIGYEELLRDPISTMTELVGSLAGWGIRLGDPTTTDLELNEGRRHHRAASSEVLDDPLATASQRDVFSLLREVEGSAGRFSLPRNPLAPSPLSLEILELAAQTRFIRRDARAARAGLNSTLGSRRRMLPRLMDTTRAATRRRRLGRRRAVR